jgi:formate C-acetyltransferase
MLGAKQAFWHGLPGVSFPELVRLAISDSMTGNPPASFDGFMERYLAAIRSKVKDAKPEAERYYDTSRDRYYDPFGSTLIEGCLESGRDMFQRGAALPGCFPVGGSGLGTAVDSLSAIKAFVYERKIMSLAEMKSLLDENFLDAEPIRMMLENGAVSFGNDDLEVDDMAARVLAAYTQAVQQLNDGDVEGQFISSLFSYTSQVSQGEVVGATPNGRRAGMPVSDNAGPSQGRDTGGPTRLLSSISRLPLDKVTGAYAMNLMIDAGILRTRSGREAFKTVIKTHFNTNPNGEASGRYGGIQLQINCVDRKMLHDAQEHPELHRDLIVRVAGFSEYFHKLDHALQNEIISRMAHESLG